MIKTFKSKGLKEIFEDGSSTKINKQMHERIIERLDPLDAATKPSDMNVPGFDFHPLKGNPTRYSVHVNGPWCVTFEFKEGHAYRVDFEQYH